MTLTKNLSILAMILLLFGCKENNKNNAENKRNTTVDSTLVKDVIQLQGFNADFYSKVYDYYWKIGNDTLDLKFNVSERIEDSTISIQIIHKKPISFSEVLNNLNRIIPKIKEDFNLGKLNSLYLAQPIFYPDLNLEFSKEYEKKFSRKNINYQKLDEFLLSTSMTSQLNSFLTPLNKKVTDYGIEKFHLLDKQYYKSCLPDMDFTNYPEFSIHGQGISISLGER